MRDGVGGGSRMRMGKRLGGKKMEEGGGKGKQRR